jgi:hypothetical protein
LGLHDQRGWKHNVLDPPKATSGFSLGFPMKIMIIRHNERRFVVYHFDER